MTCDVTPESCSEGMPWSICWLNTDQLTQAQHTKLTKRLHQTDYDHEACAPSSNSTSHLQHVPQQAAPPLMQPTQASTAGYQAHAPPYPPFSHTTQLKITHNHAHPHHIHHTTTKVTSSLVWQQHWLNICTVAHRGHHTVTQLFYAKHGPIPPDVHSGWHKPSTSCDCSWLKIP